MEDDPLAEALADFRWLYRGVPERSRAREVKDVQANNEIYPPRPDRTGSYWRAEHCKGDTETAYTSWSTDRDIAQAAGETSRDENGLPGGVIIFKVRIRDVPVYKLFYGRDDEDEYLIEGTVEEVTISEEASEEEDDADSDDEDE